MSVSRSCARAASLAAVCLQSTVLAIVLNLSSRSANGGKQYRASSAVLLTELAKLALSTGLAWAHEHAKYNATACTTVDGLAVAKDGKSHIDEQPCPTVTINVARRSSAFQMQPQMNYLGVTGHAQPSGPSRRKSAINSHFSPALELDTTAKSPLPTTIESECHLPEHQPSPLQSLTSQVFADDAWKMAVPALLFLVQNILIYVAARNLSMAVFQITFQLKTLITALCAVVMLGRRYTLIQWLSLLCLGLGVACIQLDPRAAHKSTSAASNDNMPSKPWQLQPMKPSRTQMIGLAAVLVSCVASAIAATYFELVLKRPVAAKTIASTHHKYAQVPRDDSEITLEMHEQDFERRNAKEANRRLQDPCERRHTLPAMPLMSTLSPATAHLQSTAPVLSEPSSRPPSLWIKNMQLALFSLLFGALYSYATYEGALADFVKNFLGGFNAYTWAVIAIQAVGGLLTALVIKHADNVTKGFALSASVVLTFVLSIAFFDAHLSTMTLLGGSMVVISVVSFEKFSR